MTSTVLSVSMWRDEEHPRRRHRRRGPSVPSAWLLLPRLLDVLGHHVLVRGVPIGDLHELAVLHLPDLHEPAALVVGGRDLQRRHETTEREVVDLLEALLRVLAGDLA